MADTSKATSSVPTAIVPDHIMHELYPHIPGHPTHEYAKEFSDLDLKVLFPVAMDLHPDWISQFGPMCNPYDEGIYDEGTTNTIVPPREQQWAQQLAPGEITCYTRLQQDLHHLPPARKFLPPQHPLPSPVNPLLPAQQPRLSAQQPPPPQKFLAPEYFLPSPVNPPPPSQQPRLSAQQPSPPQNLLPPQHPLPPPVCPPPPSQQPRLSTKQQSPPPPAAEEPPRRGRGRPPGSKDTKPRKQKGQAKGAAEAGSSITAPVKSSKHRVEKRGQLAAAAMSNSHMASAGTTSVGFERSSLDHGAQVGAGSLLTPEISPDLDLATLLLAEIRRLDGHAQVDDGGAVSEEPKLVSMDWDAQGRIVTRPL
ncbi:hypothetical protein G7Y79_00035g070590 [Physcia stellaris]|nr:hypothetical protein G7Y79_00035g070590 [Physcia stellaris]